VKGPSSKSKEQKSATEPELNPGEELIMCAHLTLKQSAYYEDWTKKYISIARYFWNYKIRLFSYTQKTLLTHRPVFRMVHGVALGEDNCMVAHVAVVIMALNIYFD